MAVLRIRSLGGALSAVVLAATLSLLPPVSLPRLHQLVAAIALRAHEGGMGLVIGGTGEPTPSAAYFNAAVNGYLLGRFGHDIPYQDYHALATPEQFCPIVCVPAGEAPGGTPGWPLPPPLNAADYPPKLTFGSSVFTGAGILSNALRETDNVAILEAGKPIEIFGYSQGATVVTAAMHDMINNAGTGDYPTLDQLHNLQVVLIGNPHDPLTGMLTRFDFPNGIEAFSLNSAPQHLPFLNVPLSIGATPTGVIPAEIYTAQYDGWANFPRDPTNVPAVLNAIIGILTAHGNYPAFNPDVTLDDAILLGTIDGTTKIYSIPTEQLPLLWPIYQLGDVGKVLGHALQPGLQLGINWGYGNPGNLATSQILDHVGDAVVGPWAVNASGELAKDSGLAGFIPMMDPLQMFAGAQDAGIHTFLDPLNDLLGFAGLGAVPDWLSDAMHIPYDLTNQLDQFLLSGWTDLVGMLQTALNDLGLNVTDLLGMIGPDAVFDGLPLISGAPVIDAVGLIFDLFNFFGA